MSLLERIANSNGDPQKTIDALRMINQRVARERSQPGAHLRTHRKATDYFAACKAKKGSAAQQIRRVTGSK